MGKKKEQPASAPVSTEPSALNGMIASAGPADAIYDTLKAVAAASQAGTSRYVPRPIGEALAADGLVVLSEEYINEAGEIAAMITPEGQAVVNKLNEEAVKVAAEPEKKIISGVSASVPMPTRIKKKGGKTGSQYPFESLEKGGSFFVAGTDEVKFQSSVSAAMDKCAVLVPGKTRQSRVLIKHPETKKPLLDAEGKKQYNHITVPLTRRTKKFVCFNVPSNEIPDAGVWGEQYKGLSGVGVWRVEDYPNDATADVGDSEE